MAIRISVEKIMTKNPLTVKKDDTVSKLAEEMTKKRVGSVIVLERDKPIGIITDTDLTKRIILPAKNSKTTTAGEIMSTPLVFVSPKDDYTVAIEKMKKYKIKRIPVIDKGKLVGILTTTDIARAVPDMLEILEARMKMRIGRAVMKESGTSGMCEICGNYSENLRFDGEQWICEECTEE